MRAKAKRNAGREYESSGQPGLSSLSVSELVCRCECKSILSTNSEYISRGGCREEEEEDEEVVEEFFFLEVVVSAILQIFKNLLFNTVVFHSFFSADVSLLRDDP